MKILGLPALVLLLWATTVHASDTIFYDDFQDGEADGWSAGGDGDVAMNDYQGNRSLRLTKKAYAVATIDVTGFRRIQAGAAFAAAELEVNDLCLAQLSLDSGKTWTTLARVGDGQDDSFTMHGGGRTIDLPAGVDSVMLLARAAGDGDNDTCWLDNAYVLGLGRAATIAKPALTERFLNGRKAMKAPVAMHEFRVPDAARTPPTNRSGVLSFSPSDGEMRVVQDSWRRVQRVGDAIRRLPAFEYEFAHDGVDFVPLEREVQRTDHPYWEYILLPGKAWDIGEGVTRVSLPFALQERAANCTHNGVLTFTLDENAEASRVAYQVSAETCGYLKLDLWGAVDAAFEVTASDDRHADAIAAERAHRNSRMPVESLQVLASRYPGVDPPSFGIEDGINPRDMSVFGLVVEGVHYRSDCFTREGPYPFCESMSLPSYSTAKSVFAGVAAMRMEKLLPGSSQSGVGDLIDECDGGQWQGVSVENAVDMATGNYRSTASSADEDSPPHVAFIFDDSHRSKLEFACGHFKRKAEPGAQFVYHTSDTYLVGTALTNLWAEQADGGDLYSDVLDRDLWRALNLSPLMSHSKRTYDERGQAVAGYGLTYEVDDIVRVSRWLNSDAARINGEAMLDENMLSGALQRLPSDPGVSAGSPLLRYNNGFWAYDAGPSLGCSESVWVPFMSGVSGITVALFPNDIIYYYFSDSYVFRWQSGREAAHAIKSLCQ
ncbi:MAG: hypothetical protein AAGI27_05555 [Pseudomonadota bacterium]